MNLLDWAKCALTSAFIIESRTAQYLIFAGANFYPRQGWYDFREANDDLNSAKKIARDYLSRKDEDGDVLADWCQVVDLNTQKIVFTQERKKQ